MAYVHPAEPPFDYLELNMTNYTEDEVSHLNQWGIWAEAEIERLQRLTAASTDLLTACKSMLATCGGSEHWQGRTHASLLLIESALTRAIGADVVAKIKAESLETLSLYGS